MKVISAPPRLRLAAALMALWVPVAAIETVLVTRAPWWNLPHQSIRIWCMAVALICLPLALWLLAGKRWALHLTALFGAVWCLLSAWVSFRNENPGLAFFTLLLALLWIGHVLLLRREMGRSFLDPHLPWFQGMPQPIPRLECELNSGMENSRSLRASRLDPDGAFTFSIHDQAIAPTLNAIRISDLTFRFKDREVRCRGKIISALRGNRGIGFQFIDLAPDARKELGDFIEMMRGEGYVE